MMIYPDWLMINTGASVGYGEIQIEPGWQLLSIPIKHGYWDKSLHKHIHDNTIANIKNYFFDQIEDVYGVNAASMISIANTYIGDNQFFYNFIPGVTNPLSVNNFNLVYTDGDKDEHVGFWVKSIHSTSFSIKWGEQ